MRLTPLCLLGVILAAALSAQSFEGVTVDAVTGAPLPGVCVRVVRASGNGFLAVISDSAGRFPIDQMRLVSRYVIGTAERSGYLHREFTRALPRGATPMRIELMPQAVIAGRVDDEDGFPMGGLRVELVHEETIFGQQPRPVSPFWLATNDLGEFRASGLRAGRYLLRVRTMRAVDGADGRYLPQFYPGVLSEAEATPLDVKAGQEIGGLQFHMKRFEGHRVTGRVVLPTDLDIPLGRQVSLTVQTELDGSGVNVAVLASRWIANDPSKPGGQFTLRHLPPGEHWIKASVADYSAAEGEIRGTVRLRIGESDVDGVEVPLHVVKPVDIHGRLIFAESTPRQAVLVQLYNPYSGSPPPVRTNDDGTFVLPSIQPNSYYLRVQPSRDTWEAPAVMAIGAHYGGDEVLHKRIEIEGDEGPLEITVAARNADLPIRAVDSAGQPGENAMIYMAASGPGPAIWVETTRGEPVRHLQLLPGEYRLLVVSNYIDAQVIQSPDFLAAHEAQAQKIRVQAGENPVLTLRVIEE
jgi:hypothetical protein